MCHTNSTCLILDTIMPFNPVLLYFTAGNIRYNWYVVLYGLQQSSCKIINERTHTKSEFLGLSDFQISTSFCDHSRVKLHVYALVVSGRMKHSDLCANVLF